MKLKCLNCEYEFDGFVEADELGWHSSCPECESSFDVDVDAKFVLTLWQYNFEPYTSIDDCPNNHMFLEQKYYKSLNSMKKGVNKLMDKHEGHTYTIHANQNINNGYGDDCRILGVFSPDSLEDDYISLKEY